jgi:hypothetical protein
MYNFWKDETTKHEQELDIRGLRGYKMVIYTPRQKGAAKGPTEYRPLQLLDDKVLSTSYLPTYLRVLFALQLIQFVLV